MDAGLKGGEYRRYLELQFASVRESYGLTMIEIENYITYYNHSRVQRSMGVLTPMEKHNNYLLGSK